MGAYYDEIEIEDMTWDDVKKVYHYPCPCGDRFEISKAQLANYEDIATCPSCSLIIRVIYDPVRLYLFTLPRSSLTARPISSITKTIPRTTKTVSSDNDALNGTSLLSAFLQSAPASGGEKKPSHHLHQGFTLSAKTTYTSPRDMVAYIEDERRSTIPILYALWGALRLCDPFLPALTSR